MVTNLELLRHSYKLLKASPHLVEVVVDPLLSRSLDENLESPVPPGPHRPKPEDYLPEYRRGCDLLTSLSKLARVRQEVSHEVFHKGDVVGLR